MLRSLPEVSYLTMLPALQLLTLAGNPLASAAGYSSYILAQLPGLAFLDHERVLSSARAAAAETHADEVAEARERADAAAAAAAAAAESAAHAAAMMDANLEGMCVCMCMCSISRLPCWGGASRGRANTPSSCCCVLFACLDCLCV